MASQGGLKKANKDNNTGGGVDNAGEGVAKGAGGGDLMAAIRAGQGGLKKTSKKVSEKPTPKPVGDGGGGGGLMAEKAMQRAKMKKKQKPLS